MLQLIRSGRRQALQFLAGEVDHQLAQRGGGKLHYPAGQAGHANRQQGLAMGRRYPRGGRNVAAHADQHCIARGGKLMRDPVSERRGRRRPAGGAPDAGEDADDSAFADVDLAPGEARGNQLVDRIGEVLRSVGGQFLQGRRIAGLGEGGNLGTAPAEPVERLEHYCDVIVGHRGIVQCAQPQRGSLSILPTGARDIQRYAGCAGQPGRRRARGKRARKTFNQQ